MTGKSKGKFIRSGGFNLGASPHKTGEIEGGDIDMNKVFVRDENSYVSSMEQSERFNEGNVGGGGSGEITSLPGTYSTKALDKMAQFIEGMKPGPQRTEALRTWRNKRSRLNPSGDMNVM